MNDRTCRQNLVDTFCRSKHPVIAWLTDFGLSDGYIGVMKGVVLGIAPEAKLIDITHQISPQKIDEGAWILATSYHYFPAGTIFVCVVDPGVGSERQPIAVAAGSWVFVAPNNGLLSYVLTEQPVHVAVALTNKAYHLEEISATFHGRDLFSPVAAHIANGVSLLALGQELSPNQLQKIDQPAPQHRNNQITGTVIYIDHFGNIITNIHARLVPDLLHSSHIDLRFITSNLTITRYRSFFSEKIDIHACSSREAFIYMDSSNYLGVAIQNGNASKELQVGVGMPIVLTLEPKGSL
jgi:S-adenosyl-L-methionine hydrolase (adenosine-forming)